MTQKRRPSTARAKTFFELNFVSDWHEIQRSALREQGYDPTTLTGDALTLAFFNVVRRRVEARPRRVHEAAGLVCPNDHLDGLAALKLKIEKGSELRAHLGKAMDRLAFNDGLLNDWGIHHLHLGTTMEESGFVARTGPVLFARFEADDAYLIAVMSHGNWANDELVRIMRANWPPLIGRHRLHGITPGNTSEPQRKQARKAGVNTIVNLGGRAYAGPGGGYVASGASLEVVVTADRYLDRVGRAEGTVRAAAREIRDKVAALGIRLAPRVRVELRIGDDSHFQGLVAGTHVALDLGLIEDWIERPNGEDLGEREPAR